MTKPGRFPLLAALGPCRLRRPGYGTLRRDEYLRSEEHVGQLFYEGRNLWAVESLGTESLATHTTLRSSASLRSTSILDALALRGVEDDAERVARFGCSRRFWTASVAHRVAMPGRDLDVARLFHGYTWGDLPTRYLRSYTAPEKLKRADEAARRRTGGVPWGSAEAPIRHERQGQRCGLTYRPDGVPGLG